MKSRMSVSGVAGVLLLSPLALGAQATIKATPRTSNVAGGNMCLQVSAGPTRLAGSPEGQAFMRMRAELEAVRAMRTDTLHQKQIIIVQGRLDSLGRMITGADDPGSKRIHFESRTGAPTRIEGQQIDLSDPMNQMMVTAKLRELQPQVSELSRSGPGTVIGTLNITLPTLGFIGVSATAGTFPTMIDPMQPFAYCDYPRVESVEAGSPADKAGLMSGDTLIAYNGRDLRQTNVNYPDLLVPGKPLTIQYRRDGKVYVARMRVAARDSEYTRMVTSIGACSDAEISNGCRSERVVVRAGNISAGAVPATGSAGVVAAQGGVIVATRMQGSAAGGGNAARPTPAGVSMAAASRTPLLSLDNTGGLQFAGALMRAIDEQTAQTMGAGAGLLVVQLESSAPSYYQGLRTSDWVLTANGMAVHDIDTFMKAFASKAADRVITMQVTSKSAGPRTVTIRW